jgi:hypothetical protein
MRRLILLAVAVLAVAAVAGCGSSSGSGSGSGSTSSSSSKPTTTSGSSNSAKPANPKAPEVSPSGDIPDNQAYVRYTVPGAGYSVKVPEGWSRTSTGKTVVFTDKLNSITLESAAASAAKSTVPGGKVSTVTRTAGPATKIAYAAKGTPNAVTGKAVTEAVERYIFVKNGRAAVLTVSAPKGADNVDPWKIVTDSVTWTR